MQLIVGESHGVEAAARKAAADYPKVGFLMGSSGGPADAAKDRGVRSIGSLVDFTPQYPGTVIANAVWSFGPIGDRRLPEVRTAVAACAVETASPPDQNSSASHFPVPALDQVPPMSLQRSA